MMDTWLEALEEGEVTAVIMLDMSAAFDVVDHNILLDKLKLYGLNDGALTWVKSYLDGRSQRVYCDGQLSDSLDLEAGVPQGSILGPLFYVIFSNELPEVIHNHFNHALNGVPDNNTNGDSFFNIHCKACGGVCCYADDSSYSKSSDDPEALKEEIKNKYYNDIANFMSMNKLVLNGDKTHLLVMATSQKHDRHNDLGITLDTGEVIIEPIYSEKLLGGHITNDFKWNEHLVDNAKSLSKSLTSRINALSKISAISSFKTRKMIANGIVMSLLVYLIQLWGGATNYLIRVLQVQQNRAARLVTKAGWYCQISNLSEPIAIRRGYFAILATPKKLGMRLFATSSTELYVHFVPNIVCL